MTKNFSLHEFMCKDGTQVPKDLIPNVEKLAQNLQVLRDFLGEPLHILSAYRTPTHNAKVGGKPNSMHLKALASDLTCASKSPKQLHTIIEKLIAEKKMTQGGLGLYKGFVHYDCRGTKARWNG